MTRPLRAFGEQDALPALRAALDGSGPALFSGDDLTDLPEHVAQNVALVVQSSGSTARPKRVALSADALLASAAASEGALGGPGQWLLALPTSYIAGLNVLVRAIAAGTEPQVALPFSAESFAAAAARLDPRVLRFTSLVPAQLATLLDAAPGALRLFDRVLLGGQAAPAALLARAAREGVRVTRTYGSTETSGGCVYDGAPIGTTEVRVVDSQLELSGPTLAEGYLADPARTEAAFHVDNGRRWYRTGDAGSFVDGLVSVTGRLDDVIISGGVKVSLGELERFLRDHTDLTDAVVVPLDDERWGQVPGVVSTVPVPLARVRALASAALGAAAAPGRVEAVQSIPMLPSGKPDRLAIRAALAR